MKEYVVIRTTMNTHKIEWKTGMRVQNDNGIVSVVGPENELAGMFGIKGLISLTMHKLSDEEVKNYI